MRKQVILLFVLLLIPLPNPKTYAAIPTAGVTCTKAGLVQIYKSKKYTCVRLKGKVVWDKGVKLLPPLPSPIPTPTPTPVPTLTLAPTPTPTITLTPTANPNPNPTLTTVAQDFYTPKDLKTIYTIRDREGCAVGIDSSGKQVTVPTLWAQVNGKWLQVKTQAIGWEKTCNDSRLPNNKYFAYAKAALDDGAKLRWKFVGPVNIFEHDAQGNGYSQTFTFMAPTKPLTPHPVEGGYGINWQNIVEKVNDISAGAWTDAQLTIARNKDLRSAFDGFTSYISPGAAKLDPKLNEVETILKRTFALFARVPSASKVFFVALTFDERLATQENLKSLTANSKFISDSIDNMYGINPNEPEGSVFTYQGCGGSDWGRNVSTYPNFRDSAAVILGICPAIPERDPHFEAVQGMAHEYVHTIQGALKPDPDAMAYTPCWMLEGETEWAQTAVAPDFDSYLKAQHLHPYLLTFWGLEYEQTTSRQWTAEEVASYLASSSNPATCRDDNKYALAYSLGAAATEALVSIGGSESFFALHERLNLDEPLNQAFKDVYGITWDEALPILSKVVAKKISKSWDVDSLTYQTRPNI